MESLKDITPKFFSKRCALPFFVLVFYVGRLRPLAENRDRRMAREGRGIRFKGTETIGKKQEGVDIRD